MLRAYAASDSLKKSDGEEVFSLASNHPLPAAGGVGEARLSGLRKSSRRVVTAGSALSTRFTGLKYVRKLKTSLEPAGNGTVPLSFQLSSHHSWVGFCAS